MRHIDEMDASFISATLILPVLPPLLERPANVLALVSLKSGTRNLELALVRAPASGIVSP